MNTKLRCLNVLLLALLFEVGFAQAPLQTKTKKEELIARLEQTIPVLMKEGEVPGLAIAVLQKGELLWQHGFGVKSVNGLSIMREIVAAAVGGQQPALSWINYEAYNSPSKLLLKNILAKGAATTLSDYRKERQGKAASEVVTEAQMNQLGYNLLRMQRVKDAIEVFKLNAEDFPNSANVYDSLGEAYAANGEKELAIKSYQRAVELDPNNLNGAEALKKLRENKQE